MASGLREDKLLAERYPGLMYSRPNDNDYSFINRAINAISIPFSIFLPFLPWYKIDRTRGY